MKAIMDLHTHTLAAGHAYSTLLENIDAALAMGLQYLGTVSYTHLRAHET